MAWDTNTSLETLWFLLKNETSVGTKKTFFPNLNNIFSRAPFCATAWRATATPLHTAWDPHRRQRLSCWCCWCCGGRCWWQTGGSLDSRQFEEEKERKKIIVCGNRKCVEKEFLRTAKNTTNRKRKKKRRRTVKKNNSKKRRRNDIFRDREIKDCLH